MIGVQSGDSGGISESRNEERLLRVKAKRYEHEYLPGCLNFRKNRRNTANRKLRFAIGSPHAPPKASARNGNQHSLFAILKNEILS
ncbi:hypothetical protein [Sporosarcina pasteurii]|uniref:Uncharacterized protein n=1 Tax=Sporosarcina pasteurii TaxID=1474 RepID=A0A380BM46_SPOPA|nr:hypothetical protein [Sporosarcina pasteurii]MDS9470964.1 hypothetical protein [Sporosarcina pasteurii]QBQ05383.1 hypothetical protein E2C16_06720 [Sporosarcina pasteurii]SUJ03495.1 Uncharacterised protein [Sporosarcina pasteurii]